MANEIQTFTYNNTQVRTIECDGEPWFVLKDVCEEFGETNYRRVAVKLDDDEKGVSQIDTPGGVQKMTIINESGLYSALFHMQPEKARNVSDEYIEKRKQQLKCFKRWVTSEVLPTIRKTGSYSAKSDKPSKALEIKERNSRVRLSNQFLKLSKVETLSAEYKNILVSKAAEALTGVELIPLPKSQQKMYSASEIGKMFGVSAQKIGRISNEHNLKTAEYGEWYRSKSEYSNKEVDTFVYNDRAVEKFREIFV